MKVQKSISDRSTKQEILEAYQEILGKLEVKPVTEPLLSQLQKTNKFTMSSLNKLLDQLNEQQSEAVKELQSQIDAIMDMLTILREKAETQIKTLEEEERQRSKEHVRLEEEYNYEFEKKNKRQEDELKELKDKTESELTEKREVLKIQEAELTDLRNMSKTFEPKLARGISDAVEKSTKELEIQFEHEKALALSQTKATQTLLEQRITLLEKTIEDQKMEINRLNQTSKTAVDQMTRIAERAVTKIPDNQPISSPVQQSSK